MKKVYKTPGEMCSGDVIAVYFSTGLHHLYAYPVPLNDIVPTIITLLSVRAWEGFAMVATYIGGECLMNRNLSYEVIT